MEKQDFKVSITSKAAADYTKLMNVIAVDDAAKTLTVKYGGAWSNDYFVNIDHTAMGKIDTSALTLKVNSEYSAITPLTGSIYGGTLLTITGTNWGSEKTDNPVEISFNGALGSTKCFVKTTSATQITCRVDSTISKENGKTGNVIVFLKTYEEANCTVPTGCTYTFTSNLPTITAVAAVFDDSLKAWTVEVSGTAFTGTPSTTEFVVAGTKQETVSVSSTKAVFKITNVTSNVLNNIELFFDIGVPEGNALL